MKTIDFDYFEFNKQMYRTRIIETHEGLNIVIAEYSLFMDMIVFFGSEDSAGFQAIDDNFTYYATSEEIELSDSELLSIIYPKKSTQQFIFEVTETLQRLIYVEADTEHEAREEAEKRYDSREIVLDDSDFVAHSIKLPNEDEPLAVLRVTADDVLAFDKSLNIDEVREVLCAIENDMQTDPGNIQYWVDEVVSKRALVQPHFSKGNDRASIGFFRGDGDFELLATLNNGGEQYSPEAFAKIVQTTVKILNEASNVDDIVALHREDAPDVITMDE
jgi:hypothetical protein